MSVLGTMKRVARPLIANHTGFIGSVISVRTSASDVVLTFDDGPEPGGTDGVLEALDAHGATATFFVLLTRVRRHPALLAEVIAAGHEIALHGVDHRRLTTLAPAEVRSRMTDGRAELQDVVGAEVRWFRPPYGAQTLRTWRATMSAGMTPVLWGPTTWDWKPVSQQERVDKAVGSSHRGAILLGHDGFAGPCDGVDDGEPPTVDRRDLIDRVLSAYAERGLSGVSLGAALDRGSLVKAAKFVR